MSGNEAIISRFYSAFQQKDYTTMQNCYSEDIIFNDPVFGILQGNEVRAMWEMLCKSAKDFSLQFSNIQLVDEEYASCNWTAQYTFSKTGRNVINEIKAHMRIQDGKITEHTDQFDLWKWSRQALGLSGVLLGWSGFVQNKVKYNARINLNKFMEKKSS